ncbi:MAG: hypothetical protein WBM61_04370, partial [Woeseiaceae bacterium]
SQYSGVNFSHPMDELFEVVNNLERPIVASGERHKKLVNDVRSTIAWRIKMPYLTMQSMMTMQYVPQLDRKLIRYGVSGIAAIATSMIGVVAYA